VGRLPSQGGTRHQQVEAFIPAELVAPADIRQARQSARATALGILGDNCVADGVSMDASLTCAIFRSDLHRDFLQEIHIVQHVTDTMHHTEEGLLSHSNRESRLFPQQHIEAG
jgi:hypothetical protein